MAGDTYPRFRAAAVQAAPVFLDRDATIEKACGLVERAANLGAELVVFPEVYVPAYPLWSFVYPPIETHQFFRRLFENAVEVPSARTERLCEAARQAGVYVSIGINEKSAQSMGAIWNTNLLIDRRGHVLARHRKLVPTYVEKLSWANGDGAGLQVVATDIGRLGMLICGENTNPLARFALLAQGEQVHITSYPPAFPFRRPGEGRGYDLKQAILIRAGAHSFEGKVFTIVSSAIVDERTLHEVCGDDQDKRGILLGNHHPISVIINPNGEAIGGPLENDEGIVTADIDVGESIEWKQVHDITGGYNRFDVFQLRVNPTPLRPVYLQRGGDALVTDYYDEVADGVRPETSRQPGERSTLTG